MKILGYTYAVKPVATETWNKMGDCSPHLLRIRIATDMPPQQVQSTVLHEIIEALNFHLKLGLGDDNDKVTRLEAGLYSVLTENGVDLSPLEKLIEKEF